MQNYLTQSERGNQKKMDDIKLLTNEQCDNADEIRPISKQDLNWLDLWMITCFSLWNITANIRFLKATFHQVIIQEFFLCLQIQHDTFVILQTLFKHSKQIVQVYQYLVAPLDTKLGLKNNKSDNWRHPWH